MTRYMLQKFEDAVRAHEMKGAAHPDDWDEIEEEYKRRKKQMLALIPRRYNSALAVNNSAIINPFNY